MKGFGWELHQPLMYLPTYKSWVIDWSMGCQVHENHRVLQRNLISDDLIFAIYMLKTGLRTQFFHV